MTRILCLVFFFGSIASARSVVTNGDYPWRTIGLVRNGASFCTGTLVSQCHVVTAAHCVLNSRGELSRAVVFKPHFHHDSIAATDFRMGHAFWSGVDQYEDWAILRLQQPVGRLLGWMPLALDVSPEAIARGSRFNVVGYSTDVREISPWNEPNTPLTVDENVGVSFVYEMGVLNTDALVWKGASGGPLWRLDNDGGFWVARLYGITIQAWLRGRSYIPWRLKARGALVVSSDRFRWGLGEMMRGRGCP